MIVDGKRVEAGDRLLLYKINAVLWLIGLEDVFYILGALKAKYGLQLGDHYDLASGIIELGDRRN